MPRYCYVCPDCGATVEQHRSMRRRNVSPSCGCGCRMERDLGSELSGTDTQDYDHEILSDRMGVHPSQVAEHRRMFPNIPMNDQGQIVVRNGAEERRINRELAKVWPRR